MRKDILNSYRTFQEPAWYDRSEIKKEVLYHVSKSHCFSADDPCCDHHRRMLKTSLQKNVKAIVSQTPAETEHIPDAPSTETAAPGNPASGDELFAISKLNGTVSAFTEDGCTVAPTHEEGDVAAMPAPGYEDNWEQVSVSYDSGCTFQYAYSNPQTGEVRYETATVGDVKKQTTLIICGEYDSDNVLHADRIFLYRLMG